MHPCGSPVSRSSFKDHELPPKGIFIQYYLKEMLDSATVYRFIFKNLFALVHQWKDFFASVCQACSLASIQLISSLRHVRKASRGLTFQMLSLATVSR